MNPLRKLCFFLSLTAFSVSPIALAAEQKGFNNSAADGERTRVLAFVGKKVFFGENTFATPEKILMPNGETIERLIPPLDHRYEARYEVLSRVSGQMFDDTIDFENFDHYGNPSLPKIKTPLIILINHEGRWIQSKYNYYSVSQTLGGDWAICGRLPGPSNEKADEFVQPLVFLEPLKNGVGETCSAGIRVNDIMKFLMDTRLRAFR